MKKILLSLLIISNLFAVKDILIKPNYNNKIERRAYLQNITNYPELLSSKIDQDDKNIFLYSGHFRVIYGLAYKNDVNVEKLAKNILSIANEVWNKEVEEFNFKAPINSDKYYIDIYIGNLQAFNKIENSYVTIDSLYAGYATAYSNRTPYFVINPDVDTNILKVTIAHEFFHTIQYAYGLDDTTKELWYKNIWFLEATAVMMEDEVFDEVNDYIHYLDYYVYNTNLAIEYYNSGIEYGKVVFAKFLREKYGLEFIKKIFKNYSPDKTLLEVMKKIFLDANSSFESEMLEFAKWMANEDIYFEEGSLYPSVVKYSIYDKKAIENYGFALFENGATRYLVSSNPEYLQSNFNGKQDVIDSVELNGLILLNPRATTIYTDIIQNNKFNGITLKAGWNLISNIFNESIALDTLFSDDEVVWIYRDGKYYAYSANSDTEQIIENNNIAVPNNILMSGEGAWVYTKNNKVIDFGENRLLGFNLNLKKGWNLISISSSAFDVNAIGKPITIWHFNKDTQNWLFFTNQRGLNMPYEKIEKILPGNGYFILSN